jgi:hypothetical protein
VTSKDIKYAIERFFSSNVGGQYPATSRSIEGAPDEADQGREADLRHHDAGRQHASCSSSRAEAVASSPRW